MKILFVLLSLIYSSLAMSGFETTCSTDYCNGVLKTTKCYNRDTKETYYKNPHTGITKDEQFYYKNIGKNSTGSQNAKFITYEIPKSKTYTELELKQLATVHGLYTAIIKYDTISGFCKVAEYLDYVDGRVGIVEAMDGHLKSLSWNETKNRSDSDLKKLFLIQVEKMNDEGLCFYRQNLS